MLLVYTCGNMCMTPKKTYFMWTGADSCDPQEKSKVIWSPGKQIFLGLKKYI